MSIFSRTKLALLAAGTLTCLSLGWATPAQADGILEDPLPRVEDRLCPGIVGLEREYAETMVTRIRDNAEMFGLALDNGEICKANMVVAFVDDGQQYLADLVDRRGYLFREMDRPDREDLLAQTGPVRVWNQVSTRNRDGLRVGVRNNLVNVPQTGMWSAHSRIYNPVRKEITYSLVLINRDAARGLSLGQLADYASLRAFSTEFPHRAGTTESSILSLFEADMVKPDSLTQIDSAWLDELYRGIPNIPASIRLRGIEPAG